MKLHPLGLMALALVLGHPVSAGEASSLQCYGRSFKSLSAASQFMPGLFQLDGTCYAYAATASLEAAHARKHGKAVQILPTALAFRQSHDSNFNLQRILKASTHDTETGTIGPIPQSFYDGGLVLTVQGGLRSGPSTPSSKIVPRYSLEALLEYREFSKGLVAEASCQYYEREPLHLEESSIKTSISDRRRRFNEAMDEQGRLFIKLDNLAPDDTSGRQTLLSRVRELNRQLEDLNQSIRKLLGQLDAISVKLRAGVSGDQALSCRITESSKDFEQRLILKHGGVDTSGIRPLVLFTGLNGKERSCDAAEGERRTRLLTRAICAGIPAAMGTYSMKKFLLRDRDLRTPWKPYAPTGAAGDVVGSGHAMTLQGVEDIQGVPHFVFRNSWGRGTEAALPLSEGCAIDEAVVFLDTDSPSSGTSEWDAWQAPGDDALRLQSSRLFRAGFLSATLRNDAVPATTPTSR